MLANLQKSVRHIARYLTYGLAIQMLMFQTTLATGINEKKLTFNKITSTAVAEDITIKGKVTDEEGNPIPGAAILIKGTSKGTSTDIDGDFTLEVPEDAVLVVSFLGFVTQEIEVGNQANFEIVLIEDSSQLEEVVVVGYGTQKKINLTGAVSQVNAEEAIDERPVTSLGQALQGVAPGLNVSTGNGTPGSGYSYNIRGTTSLNGGSPLILVDGTEQDPNLVPPEDVASVTVLKDAASAAIYGARASFGVILITTKSGEKSEGPTFNYSSIVSWSDPTTTPEKVDPITQIRLGGISWENAGRTPGFYWGRNVDTWVDLYNEVGPILDGGRTVDGVFYPLGNTNMIEEMTETSVTSRHNISASGGSENTTYYLSAGIMNNNGILRSDKDKYSRKNILGKIDTKVTDWFSIGATIGFTRGFQTMPWIPNNENYMYDVAILRPKFWLTGIDEVSGAPWGFSPQMVDLGALNTDQVDNTNIQGRVTIKPFTGFEINGTYSVRAITGNNFYHVNSYEQANPPSGPGVTFLYRNNPNSLRRTARYNDFNNLSVTGTYTKTLANDHTFKLMLGYAQEVFSESSFWAQRDNLISDNIPSLNLATGNQFVDDNVTEWSTISGFSRLNYNYKEKYLFEAVARYDGASRFPMDDRFVYSPSASVGWIISEESFMAGTDRWLDFFKIRASYGSQGNQNVGAYAYLPSMSTGNANWIVGSVRPLFVRPGGLVSDSFTWEKVNTTNFGVDLGIFRNRLGVTAEIFQRETIGMLTSAEELPAVLGTSAPMENAANLKVNGWELSLNWRDNLSSDFSYNVGVNFWDDLATISKFGGNPTGQLSNYYVGRELGEIWGYETDRLFQAEDIVGTGSNRDLATDIPDQSALFNNQTPFPGDVKYKDLNGDGKVDFGTNTLDDPGDLKILGNSRSRYQFGIRLGAKYKSFDISVFMQGVAKRDLFTSGPMGYTIGGQYESIYTHTLDYWTPENTDAFYPRLDDRPYNRRTQSRYLLDGSYLRFKNVRLGYTLSKNFAKKIGLKSVKIYVTGENLFLLSGLPAGIDPEVLLNATYPLRKDFAIGTNITF